MEVGLRSLVSFNEGLRYSPAPGESQEEKKVRTQTKSPCTKKNQTQQKKSKKKDYRKTLGLGNCECIALERSDPLRTCQGIVSRIAETCHMIDRVSLSRMNQSLRLLSSDSRDSTGPQLMHSHLLQPSGSVSHSPFSRHLSQKVPL